MHERVGVIGLGYVGLPVALAFADRFEGTVGFDVKKERVEGLWAGHDVTAEVSAERLLASSLRVTADPADLAGVTFFVVTVPTPIDDSKRPDLTAMIKASETVGRVLKPGAVVVYESTVYPGVTEEICGPVLERISGLRCGIDFTLGGRAVIHNGWRKAVMPQVHSDQLSDGGFVLHHQNPGQFSHLTTDSTWLIGV